MKNWIKHLNIPWWIYVLALILIMFLKRQCEIVSKIAVFSVNLDDYEHVFFNYNG